MTVAWLAALFGFLLASGGCGSTDGGIADWLKPTAPTVLVQVEGLVWLPLGGGASLRDGAARREEARAQTTTTGVPAPGATVYVEERPDLTATTDAQGRFLIRNVPAGKYHLIAETMPGATAYKQRSDLISLTGSVTSFQLPAPLQLAVADRRLWLSVKNGGDQAALPGVNVTLWGRRATTGADGGVELGPLPSGIWPLQLAAVGFRPRSLLLGFSLNRQQYAEVQMTPLTGADPNQAPVVEVEKGFATLRTNEIGGLAAVGNDPDGDALTFDWVASGGGTLSVTRGPTTLFTAPADPGKIQVAVIGRDDRGGVGRCLLEFDVVAGGSVPNPNNRLPLAASRPYPADGAQNQSITPVLTWQAADPDGDPLTFSVALAPSGQPLRTVATATTAASFQAPRLTPFTTYFWQVICRDPSGGTSLDNPVWRFATGDGVNQPPNRPARPLPPDLAVDQLPAVRLAWDGGDPDPGDSLTYEVWIGSAADRLELASITTGAAFPLSGLGVGERVYWRVVARDSRGGVVTGDVWRFDTFGAANRPPGQPVPDSPADGATGVDLVPRLAWQAADPDGDALRYDVFLGTGTPLVAISRDLAGPNMTVPAQLQPGTRYTWQVVVRDARGATNPNPAVWSFTTRTPANAGPDIPLAVAPADGATQVSRLPVLAWRCADPDGDPLTFDVVLDQASPPTNLAGPGVTTPWWPVPVALDEGQTYHWFVVARDGRGGETTSPVFRFTTAAGVDSLAPSLVSVSPAAGATGLSRTTPIDLVFSEPMNRTTVEAATSFVVSPPVAGTFVWSSAAAVKFFPSEPWASGSYHTVTLATNTMRDLANNLVPTGRTIGFAVAGDLPLPTGKRSAGFALVAGSGQPVTVTVPGVAAGGVVQALLVGQTATAGLQISGDRAVVTAAGPTGGTGGRDPLAAWRATPEAAFRELERMLPTPALSVRGAAVAAPEIGSTRTFFIPANQGLATTTAFPGNLIEAICWGATDRTLLYVDRQVVLRDFTVLTALRTWFEEVVRPRLTDHFGVEPPFGPDHDSRLTILFTDAMHPDLFGLFNAADLFLAAAGDPALRESNQRKMLYVRFSGDDAAGRHGAVAHEFAHMIQFWEKRARAGANVTEETWLAEGLALLAEEICGYGPAQGNARLSAMVKDALVQMRTLSVTGWQGPANYGLSYLFARFLAEGGRYGTTRREATRALVSTGAVGQTNVTALAKEGFTRVLARFGLCLLLNRHALTGPAEYGLRDLNLMATYAGIAWPGVPVDEVTDPPGASAEIPANGLGFFRRTSTLGGTVTMRVTNLTAPVEAWFLDERR